MTMPLRLLIQKFAWITAVQEPHEKQRVITFYKACTLTENIERLTRFDSNWRETWLGKDKFKWKVERGTRTGQITTLFIYLRLHTMKWN